MKVLLILIDLFGASMLILSGLYLGFWFYSAPFSVLILTSGIIFLTAGIRVAYLSLSKTQRL